MEEHFFVFTKDLVLCHYFQTSWNSCVSETA